MALCIWSSWKLPKCPYKSKGWKPGSCGFVLLYVGVGCGYSMCVSGLKQCICWWASLDPLVPFVSCPGNSRWAWGFRADFYILCRAAVDLVLWSKLIPLWDANGSHFYFGKNTPKSFPVYVNTSPPVLAGGLSLVICGAEEVFDVGICTIKIGQQTTFCCGFWADLRLLLLMMTR